MTAAEMGVYSIASYGSAIPAHGCSLPGNADNDLFDVAMLAASTAGS